MVRRLRAARPNLTLSSDFIVGFPGETEEDFEKTMKLIEDVGFDTSFSFVYSRRPGTPAADLSDDTPQDVKLRRLQRLQALINEQAAAIARGMIGTRQRLLVEGPSRRDPNELMGRTENNRIVNFAAPARLIGQMVDVIITDAHTNSLRAGSPTWTATPKGPNDPSPLTRPAQHAHRRQPDGDNTHWPISAAPGRKPAAAGRRHERQALAPRQPRHHRGRNHRAGRPRPAPLPRTGRAPRPDGGRHPAGLVEIGVGRRTRNCARNRRRTPPSCRRWTTRATASRCAPAAATCAAHRAPARLPEQHPQARHHLRRGSGRHRQDRLAVACAIDAMERDTVQRLVLTRPAVEAGERLGFLPGDRPRRWTHTCARCTTRSTT